MKIVKKLDSIGDINYQWAFKLIHFFAMQGVCYAVISPGSRSTPLALACEQHAKLTTFVQIDERSAAFFALGLAQKKHQPVILICTSGSAVANWLPAVVEANHSYTPLLLLSADRPTELHHCGANQTIDQGFIFGSHVRDFIALEHADETCLKSDYLKNISIRAYNRSLCKNPGPVHINIPFREPILPYCESKQKLNKHIQQLSQQIIANNRHWSAMERDSEISYRASMTKEQINLLIKLLAKGEGIIVCGRLNQYEQEGFSQVITLLADKLNCPVLIDPLSNLRFSTSSKAFIYNYDFFLRKGLRKGLKQELKTLPYGEPEWIIRFGQFPVSKALFNYLNTLKSQTILVSSFGDTLDPIHKATMIVHSLPTEFSYALLDCSLTPCSNDWLSLWQQKEHKSQIMIEQSLDLATKDNDFFEGHLIQLMLQYIPKNSLLFSGNSMAIRDFDTFLTYSSSANKSLQLFANRGTSGIDGNISTFFGLLAGQKNYAVALLGDLTFYHDMNGLLIAKQLATLGYNAMIIVVNNNGGGIFNYLPQQQLDDFDKLWKTEINLDFQHAAELYGLAYSKVDCLKDLDQCLKQNFKKSGIQLVEIIIDQKISVKCHKQIEWEK